MTSYIYLDNYRGFSNELIPLKLVNWLVGENSTGKTSFMEILDELSYPPFWIFEPRIGIHTNHPRHFLDLVSAAASTNRYFTIGAVTVNETEGDPCFGMLVTYANLEGRPTPSRISIIENRCIKTIDGRLWISGKKEPLKARSRDLRNRLDGLSDQETAKLLANCHKSSIGFKSFIAPEDRSHGPMFERFAEVLFEGKGLDERNILIPSELRNNFIDLAPIRTKPRRTYDAPQTEFSPEGDHVPYMIRKRLASKTKAENFRQFLESVGQQSGLFQSIRIKEYGRGSRDPFELQVVLGQTPLGLESVGYGVSQSLPVLVEMFVRPSGAVFAIQQPEVHLHPKAQASFGDIVADLARRDNKGFFIETHSDFAIDRFRLNIRQNGSIDAQLLYFERSDLGNSATQILIDDSGGLPDDQPSGYREFFFNESLSLLG